MRNIVLSTSKIPGQPGYDPSADITADGLIDSADLAIARDNQGHTVLLLLPARLTLIEPAGAPDDRILDIDLADSSTVEFQIRNDGQRILTIGGMQILGDHAADFAFEIDQSTTTGVLLPPNESATVRVRFIGIQPALREAGLIFFHNDPSQPSPLTLTLRTVGDATPPQLLPATINGGLAQRSFISTIQIPFTDDVGGSFTLDDLSLVRNGSEIIPLDATTLAIDGLTATLDMGLLDLTEGLYELRISPDTIADLAGNPLDIDNDGVSDAGAGKYASILFHRLPGDANGDQLVSALDMRDVTLALNKLPGEAGHSRNADLNDDGAVDELDLALVRENLGNTVVSLGPPTLTLIESAGLMNDNQIEFGIVHAPTSMDLVIRNDGQSDLSLAAIQITGPDAADFAFEAGPSPTTSGLILAPGQEQIIRVFFTGSFIASRSAQLVIFHNDPIQASPATTSITTAANPIPLRLHGPAISIDSESDRSHIIVADIIAPSRPSSTLISRREPASPVSTADFNSIPSPVEKPTVLSRSSARLGTIAAGGVNFAPRPRTTVPSVSAFAATRLISRSGAAGEQVTTRILMPPVFQSRSRFILDPAEPGIVSDL
jgi:hypothetical protein